MCHLHSTRNGDLDSYVWTLNGHWDLRPTDKSLETTLLNCGNYINHVKLNDPSVGQ